MSRWGIVVLISMIVMTRASSQTRVVSGKVTYVSSGNVYTSLGRESGVKDSALVHVVAGMETTAVLKVFAVSSKSSVCGIMRAKGTVTVGSNVVATVAVEQKTQARADSAEAGPAVTTNVEVPSPSGAPRVSSSGGSVDWINLRGRVSTQYYATSYEVSDFNITQPGLVLNLRAQARDLPLKLDIYSNLRTMAFGNTSPFSRTAMNQSRVYRLSLEYDDGVNTVAIGRIIPTFGSSIGYVDGGMASRRIANFQFGTLVGFQPDLTLRGTSGDFMKFAVFASYRTDDARSTASLAYARTYFHSDLDREATSLQANLFLTSSLFVYSSAEIDLRKKSGDVLKLSPSLTTLYMTVNHRVTSFLTLGIGGDASRPFYNFSSVRNVPDSLLEQRLRGGANLNVSLSLPAGIMIYDTYTPRSSESSFGAEYSNYSAVNFANILSTGVGFRSNLNVNSNAYTRSVGYGANIQRNFEGLVDVTIRYQQYTYTIKQTSQRDRSYTVGGDLLVSLTRQLVLMTSYDRLDGYGTISHTIFAELSFRF
jgi:hypothetical protein